MKVNITKEELSAIVSMKEDVRSMLGGADNDEEWSNYVCLINKMLDRNNYDADSFSLRKKRDTSKEGNCE
jgi:hypothetical protein